MVDQLRFTRSEWQRGLDGISNEDAQRRLLPMNSISWMVGHLAWQENRYWNKMAQGVDRAPNLDELTGTGRPASVPSFEEMIALWRSVTEAADSYLDTLNTGLLNTYYQYKDRTIRESVGTLLYRTTYHYWFHTGEVLAIRQMLGHDGLPEFVGRFSSWATYRQPET